MSTTTTAVSLFDQTPPMVRHTDPPTSKLASKRLRVGPGQRKVLAALLVLGEGTDHDIRESRACSGMGYGSASKRRNECERYGWVEAAGVRGSRIVWRLTATGMAEVAS